tara:strand:- start:11375 stop:12256 length:882 start_codon:yes stop_codon:yes gene_type:complete
MTAEKKLAQVVLVTGMSGAGRSSTLNIFEDLGFEAVDNLPFSLLEDLIRGGVADRALAIGLDIRNRDFVGSAFHSELKRLRRKIGCPLITIFLDCDDDVLIKRYTETRRRHPLANERPLAVGIQLERRAMRMVRSDADILIDTSHLSPWALKSQLVGRFAPQDRPSLRVSIISFSFREGAPREADLVFDVRFLRNPHYVDELRSLTGHDQRVGNYVSKDPDFTEFMNQLESMMALLLPRFKREGKSYLTIAIGCTGGRHRSVFTAKRLYDAISSPDLQIQLYHRDLELTSEGR